MALYRNITGTSPMDYGTEGRAHKAGTVIDERLDSGIDSLREDEMEDYCSAREDTVTAAMERLSVDEERWRTDITEEGDTYLHLAVIHEAQDMALKMIEMSIRHWFLDKQNYQRQTALHLAVVTEQPLVVERLLKAGCDPTLVDNKGNTALHIACKTGSLACFSLLTQNCAEFLPSILQMPNYSGQKCLHVVAVHGFLSMVESLLCFGADINEQEQCNGRTALHLAVDMQNLELVKLLICKGADVNSLTYGGHSAYHLTHGRQNNDIQKVLQEVTDQDLWDLPESESEGSEDEYEYEYDNFHSSELQSDEEYDDIRVMGQE
ncbi:nuclear factor of kappa light polypeptide gene enhancer in B-cells inhibitor, alpha b [Tachysurus fulvidraco]|uniref:nuclear factor of kappa light polypeptide gene enhancer in B-cells inhibitor, alpha b n=1 Tax=Tachysurus fulvidraco TaxID=1234273 RepID=UPI000F5108BB|nr:nuclear factor of kappa light polypeptide gene enhancer in B-cells inhibitor, alpha b [Tachysurus fulvidraco]